MQNFRKTDREPAKVVWSKKLEDIQGGFTLAAADFADGVVVPSGTPVGRDANGLGHPVKTAEIVEAAGNTATAYKVKKGHIFKVGDFFASAVGAKAYPITAIDTSDANSDTITVSTTLGVAVANGATVFQAAAESATTTSAFRIVPEGATGRDLEIVAGDSNMVQVVRRGTLISVNAPAVSTALKNALPHLVWE